MSRPSQLSCSVEIISDGKVKNPENPVSITASTCYVMLLFLITIGKMASQF